MIGFKNYIKISDKRYSEYYGLDFEQFAVGQKFQHRPGLTISQQDNKEEALDTINNARHSPTATNKRPNHRKPIRTNERRSCS